EGDPTATGGFALINAKTGEVVKTTPTIPPAAQAEGYAGGGLWSTPAYDPTSKYLYWGAGNPNSKTKQYKTTDAILKIDVNPARATFGQIVASYEGNVDQYTATLQELSHSPACEVSASPEVPDPLDDPVCGQLDLDFGAAANLFTTGDGTKVAGDLQKSGVYHVANLDAVGAAAGQPLVHRPLSADAGAPVTNLTSAGVAIAEHQLFVAAGGLSYVSAPGYVIAYAAR